MRIEQDIGEKTLANIKSQIKRNRQNEKRRLRNRDFRGAARAAVKGAHAALESGQETHASVMSAISALDKAAQKGAIHPRNAARRKGRLMKRLAAMGAQPTVPAPVVEKKEPEKKPVKAKEAKPKEDAVKKTTTKKTAEKKTAAKKSAEKK